MWVYQNSWPPPPLGHYTFYIKLKFYAPFSWMGFNYLKARATLRRQCTFYHKVPRNSWYSFYQPRKDERLSRPWSHPVVLNMGTLDWESSVLTTRPPIKTDSLKIKIHIIVNYRNDKLRIRYNLDSHCNILFHLFLSFFLL